MQEQVKPSPYAYPVEEEFSFKQFFEKRKDDVRFLWKFRVWIAAVMIAGAGIGLLAAWKLPPTYTARLSFVVEDTKVSGGSMLSALAGQFGFDLGSMGGSSGVLAGDNVQALLRSQKIIKQALLTPLESDSSYTLADRYAEAYKLKDKWTKYTGDGRKITFPANDQKYSRLQDSLLFDIVKRINEKELSVNKTDKKLSFFELNVTTRDEPFSQLFTERLITVATDFYIKTKTSRLRNNIARLQGRADSITRVLNRQTYSASAANQILLDLNPAYPTANVGVEVGEREKMLLSTIYAEVVKNLEVSKTMLAQETPTFQVVDEPELPLKKNRLGYLKGAVSGALIASLILAAALLVFKR